LCRVPFSCFALADLFSVVPRASGIVFMFCAPGHVFGGTKGIGSRFHVLRSRTRFRQYRGCHVSFSYFTLPDSFSAVTRACNPVLMFSAVPRVSGPFFMFCAPGIIFGGTEGVVSRFHVFCSRTRFRRYRGRLIQFSCISLPDMFLAVSRASGPFFTFCSTGHVFDGTEGVGSLFHILCSRTLFRQYGGHRVPFSCFKLPYSFSTVSRASSLFKVLHSRTHFRRYRGRRVPFSYFSRQDSFSAVSRASVLVFMFCAPGHVFGGTEGVEYRFHVLCARTHFRR
jgi:hypothetical protein